VESEFKLQIRFETTNFYFEGNGTMAPAVASRSAPLKCVQKIGRVSFREGRSDNPSSSVGPGTELSSAGTRRLRVNWKKVGRFVVKCLADFARDSAAVYFKA
jgi:hypothetical protein